MSTPSVLFVCVKNAGKSQMAAALMRARYGEYVEVASAGTKPGVALNSESAAAVAEVGGTFDGEFPKPVTVDAIECADVVVIVGEEADLEGPKVRRWLTDEPSLRGIEGAERMALIREELIERVDELASEFGLHKAG